MFRCVADDRDDDDRDEELRESSRPRELLQRVDEDLAHERCPDGGTAERRESHRK